MASSLLIGCSGDPASGFRAYDGERDGGEAAKPWPEPGCKPGEFYSCHGGSARCSDGKVIRPFRGELRCGHSAEVSSQGGCPDVVVIECRDGCADPDPRYPALRAESHRFSEREAVRGFCAEGSNRKPGDPCLDDDACRPAAVGVTRLECDEAAGACVEVARPDAPPELFGDCGLPGDIVAPAPRLRAAPNCALCLLHAPEDQCARQACTVACEFDEDCPTGAICGCPDGFDTCFCVPSADARFDAEVKWLTCRSDQE